MKIQEVSLLLRISTYNLEISQVGFQQDWKSYVQDREASLWLEKKITVNKYAYLHDRSCKSSEKKSLNKLFYFGLRLLSDEVIESYY